MSDKRRTSPRHDLRLPIEYAVGEEWRQGTTRNLSLGGVFVETEDRLAMGTRIRLRFRAPAMRDPIEAGGQVRWADDSGFGVQFDGLRARDVWALNKLFERP